MTRKDSCLRLSAMGKQKAERGTLTIRLPKPLLKRIATLQDRMAELAGFPMSTNDAVTVLLLSGAEAHERAERVKP